MEWNKIWHERTNLDDSSYYIRGGLMVEFDSHLDAWELKDCQEYPTRVISHHSSLEFAKWAGDQIERETK